MENIPEEIVQIFLRKGLDPDKALSVLKTDMSREETYCDATTLFCEEGIACLFTTVSLQKKEGAFLFSSRKPERKIQEWDWVYLPMEEVLDVKLEEQVSVFRVIVETKNGPVLLFYATAHCLKEASEFCETVKRFLESGEKPKEKKKQRPSCPRCHTPYADPEKKICRKCSDRGSLIKKLLPFFRRYSGYILLVLLTVLLGGVLDLIAPILSQQFFFDQVLSETSPYYGKVLAIVLCVAGANFLVALNSMFTGFVGARVSAYVTYDLKKTIFSSFERLSYSFFSSRHTGKLLTQINADATTLYWFFCDGVPYFLSNIVQIVGILVIMFTIHPMLTVVIFLPMPVLFVGYALVLRHFKKLQAESYSKRSKFNSILSDVLGGMRIVKAFSREETEVERFHSASTAFGETRLKVAVRNNTILPFMHLLVQLSTYLVWGVGGYFVIQNGVSPGSGISYGTLALFVSYLSMLYQPLNFFADFFGNMADSLNALQRLFEIYETEPEVKEAESPVSLPEVRGEVEFSHVDFSYAPGKKTIQDVSFHVPAGKTLGIVGHTGAGKSTLANLLTRLYDPASGKILIDGVDIREISLADLHKNIAIVSQETYLFRGTILDNIRYSAPDITREEAIAAAMAAGAHDFIVGFPDGYDTMVGMDKKLLSGGEKQRISIARAILKNPKILILDEATAAMDTKTERRIQEALARITRNRTTITIAHRLSTLRDADSLIVVEDGRVVEAGTHEELLKQKGVYHTLYQLQMEAMKTIGIEE